MSKKNNPMPFFFIIAILLLPYDAIKGVMPSSYRPISVYFFLIFLILYILKYRSGIIVNADIKRSLYFYIYAITVGFVLSVLNTGDPSFFLNQFFSLSMGIVTFLSVFWGFRKLKKNKFESDEQTIEFLFKLIFIAYLFPIFIWILDILFINGHLPFSIKQFIMTVFGGFQSNRLTGTTLEASWLSKHALFIIPVNLYLYKTLKKKIYLLPALVGFVTFILTFSLQGVAYLSGTTILYFFLKGYLNGKLGVTIKNLIIAILIISLIAYIFYFITINYLPNTYYSKRLENLTSLQSLLFSDGSSFIRIGIPIISVLIFRDNIFGVGLGAYPYYFPMYVNKYFQESLKFNEVQKYYFENSAPGGSALLRVLAEFGILGSLIFYNFIIKVYQNVKKIKGFRYNNYLLFWFSLGVSFLLQEGYACVQFWLTLGVLSSIKNNERNEKVFK